MEPNPSEIDSLSPDAGALCAPETCDTGEPSIAASADMLIAFGFIALMLIVLAFIDHLKRGVKRYIK